MIKEIPKRIIISIYYRSKFERIVHYYFKFYHKSKIKRAKNELINFFEFSKNERIIDVHEKFMKNLAFFQKNTNSKKVGGILLVQLVEDYEFTIKFAAASKVIAEKRNLKVNFYNIHWMKRIGWTNKYETFYSFFNKTRLEKIHLSFGEKVLMSFDEKYPNQKFIKQELKKIISNIKSPQELLKVKFEEVNVGDLIYDSYLRYFHQPTIETICKDVILIIEVALNIFYSFKKLIQKFNIKGLVNSYTSYIHHGITSRLCLEYDIDVYIVGKSRNFLLKKLDKSYPYHQLNHTLLDNERQLSIENLLLAEKVFTSRFSGEIDTATSYMKTSAFHSNDVSDDFRKLFSFNKRNIVVYAHDFYDSPHINRMLQFPDLFQFLKCTLAQLINLTDTTVFIKTHPNGIDGCKEQTIELVKSFQVGHFHILDEKISNLNIIELKPTLICTARGTVGIEMAYYEIPTVALYDNIYINFNFVQSCSDKETYYRILRGEEDVKIDFDKKKIYSFYYQAYLDKSVQDDLFNLIEDNTIGTFNDEYLKKINSSGFSRNREKLIHYYEEAFNEII